MSDQEQVDQTNQEQQIFENQEEQKQNEKKEKKQDGEKRQRNQDKYDWDKTKITAATPIPEIPKTKDRVVEPKKEDLQAKIDKYDNQIKAILKKQKDFIIDLRTQNRSKNSENKEGVNGIRAILNEKREKRNELETEFKAIKALFDAKKSEINTIFEQTQKIRQNMKSNLDKLEVLEDLLEQKEYELQNGTLSLQQEKKTLQEISNLKKSLPLARQLAPLEEKQRELTKEKKEIGDKMHVLFEELQEVRDQVNEQNQFLTELKQEGDATNSTIEPQIEAKKAEYQVQIDKLRQQKIDANKDYKAQLKAFYEQQDLIRYHDFVKRHRDNAAKFENREKRKAEIEQRRAERLQRDQEREKEEIEAQFQKDITLCESLIAVCNLLRKNAEVQNTDQLEEQKVSELSEEALQKENLTVMKPKKEQNNQFMYGGQQKKGKKKHHKQQEVQQDKPKFTNLSYQDLSDFATLKISAPTLISELPKAIEALEEKKKYFENLPRPDSLEYQQQQEQQKTEEPVKKSNQSEAHVEDDEQYPEL